MWLNYVPANCRQADSESSKAAESIRTPEHVVLMKQLTLEVEVEVDAEPHHAGEADKLARFG